MNPMPPGDNPIAVNK